MFKGKFYHTLDAKNRTIVPSKLRDELGDTFVITVGLEGCLYIYPNDEWEVFAEELKKLPGTKDARDLRRKFMSNATDCDTDKQGRFLIPAELCEEAFFEQSTKAACIIVSAGGTALSISGQGLIPSISSKK